MHRLVEQIEGCVLSRRLLANGDRVLIALSGGVDSMVLLHCLHALSPVHRWTLGVAHLNHRLRGKAAEADHEFARRAAATLDLPFISDSTNVAGFAHEHGISVEMAARKLRHEFLAGAARRMGASRIAIAHHADDQVELFLLRLLRGAGSEGLSGMNWAAPSPADPAITLVRPLLAITKVDLQNFANENRISHREDRSNTSTRILRNRIRHELLPLLRAQYQPGIDAVLRREADLLREDATYILAEATRWVESPFAEFTGLPVALQRRVLQIGLLQAAIPPDFDLIEKLRRFDSKWVAVSPSLACRRNAKGRIESTALEPVTSFSEAELVVPLRDSGSMLNAVSFSEVLLQWKRSATAKFPRPKANRECFDAEAVGDSIVLRHWRAGDRFQPIGMPRPVKLQDLFVNAKIPQSLRPRLVVAATASGDIFWVEGLRIGDCCKVTPATTRRLDWRWKRFTGNAPANLRPGAEHKRSSARPARARPRAKI